MYGLQDWLGGAGVFMILLAYFLGVMKLMETGSLTYILLNLAGASLACLASVLLDYLPFIILEGAWAAVSFVALGKWLKGKGSIAGKKESNA